jgi:hypothetical protein
MTWALAFLISSLYLITSTFVFLTYLYYKENKIEQRILEDFKKNSAQLKMPIVLVKEEQKKEIPQPKLSKEKKSIN